MAGYLRGFLECCDLPYNELSDQRGLETLGAARDVLRVQETLSLSRGNCRVIILCRGFHCCFLGWAGTLRVQPTEKAFHLNGLQI